MRKIYLTLALITSFIMSSLSQVSNVTLQLSPDGRYLQGSNKKPFFIHACTSWSLISAFSDKEVTDYLTNRVAAKFNTIQMCAVFKGENKSLIDSVFRNGDFLQPVSRFWDHVDWVVKQATDRGLVVLINPIWKSDLNELIQANGPDKCRKFGQWFASRYKSNPKVIYFLGGDQVPEPVRSEIEEMGRGIQDIYGGKAIIGYLSEADQSGSEAFPQALWLTLNMTHAYSPAYGKQYPYSENIENWADFPTIPILFAEGYYDFGEAAKYDEKGIFERWGNRRIVRRQAWWNFLSGGTGNAYGAEGICYHKREGQNWQAGMQLGSNKDMGIMRLFIDKINWWKLIPDIEHNILSGGYGTYMEDDYAPAAASEDGKLMVIYSPVQHDLELVLPRFGQNCQARWYDPTNGKYANIDLSFPVKKKKAMVLPTPGINNSGENDWVLIIVNNSVK